MDGEQAGDVLSAFLGHLRNDAAAAIQRGFRKHRGDYDFTRDRQRPRRMRSPGGVAAAMASVGQLASPPTMSSALAAVAGAVRGALQIIALR